MSDVTISVCRGEDLAEGNTAKFRIGEGKDAREGFVVRHGGNLHAYRNECRHIPMTMDWVENRFLSRDRCWIQCATHGALFLIEDGECIAGPCAGQSLKAIACREDGQGIWVQL